MPQEVRFRKQRVVNYSGGNTVSEDLGRGMIYRELYLRLQGTMTFSDSADNTTANLLLGDEWAIVKAIKIVANHTDVIKRVRGAHLFILNYLWYGQRPNINDTLGDESTTTINIDSTLILPLWMPRSVKPIDNALDARELSGLTIEVEWGADANDISSGADSAFDTDPTLTVFSLESFGIQGPFSQWRTYPIELEVVADNPELQYQLPVSYMYRGFTMIATDGGDMATDIINNVKLRSGSTVYEDMAGEVIAEIFPLRNSCDKNPQMRADAYNNQAIYRLDHVTDGYMTEAIDTLGFSEFTLEFDASVGSGTTKIIIYPDQIVPVRGGGNE